MKLVIAIVVFLICFQTYAQKPVLDVKMLDKWPTLGNIAVSFDGNFTSYLVYNKPISGQTLIVKSIRGNWKKEFINVAHSPAFFSKDSRTAYFIYNKDSLCIVNLKDAVVEFKSHIRSFKLFVQNNVEWLVLHSSLPRSELLLSNLVTGREIKLMDVSDYWINNNGNTIVVKTKLQNGISVLGKLNIYTGEVGLIYKGQRLRNLVFDKDGSQLAFISNYETNNTSKDCLVFYKDGMDSAISIENKYLDSNDFVLDQVTGFSKDVKKIYFTLKKSKVDKPRISDEVNVHVWSYLDARLQSQQIYELNKRKLTAFGVIDIYGKNVRFFDSNEELVLNFNYQNSILLSLKYGKGDTRNEWYWNNEAHDTLCVSNITTDTKRKILTIEKTASWLSPNEKFIIYYNAVSKNYYCYEIASGISRNITVSIKTKWTTYLRSDEPVAKFQPLGIAGFMEGDNTVLVYDQYDIWKISMTGKSTPINLTNHFGSKNKIQFRLAVTNKSELINLNGELILNAFDQKNKDNGYYKINLEKISNPEPLTMGRFIYSGPPEAEDVSSNPISIIINDKQTFIIQRMSAQESRNYYLTNDFKTFTQLTDLNPEKDYNWLSSELVTWKSLDGRILQGILYKPENFDYTKKYPLIFNFYEKKSYLLNAFLQPGLMFAELDIPYFVSNGYLVFTPDICYKIGEPGKSAYNSVISAARYLSRLLFVDSTKLGLQGHSFGGFETNYIITHSKTFAAAMSASGMSNFISCYNSILEDGTSRQRQYEMMRDRIGASLWQSSEKYIANSPVLFAANVNTPVLMMHNKGDGDVAFEQGLEFFTALRRLGKRAWLLQYDGEGHGIFSEKRQMDYTIRTKQFFDHYLKNCFAPKWMTKGIPASKIGIVDGLDLDYETRTPSNGILSPEKER